MEGVASCSKVMANQDIRKKKRKPQNGPIVIAKKQLQQKLDKKRKNKDGSEGAKRKKVKKSKVTTSSILDTAPGQQGKDGESEDVAESIDSGCVVDGPSDISDVMTDWPQVQSVLLEENHFISSLLSWIPADVEKQDQRLLQLDNNELKQKEELKELRAKYRSMLGELKRKRRMISEFEAKKEEKKIKKEMKDMKIQKTTSIKHTQQAKKFLVKQSWTVDKTPVSEVKKKRRRVKKPIYNSEGELVFNKFDFSCKVTEENPYKKSRDIKRLFRAAIKEKERIERMDKKGKTDTAAKLKEHRSWAAAMRRAEGGKVRDDVDMLKKSIKRKEQRKKSSQKKWEQHNHKMEKKKQDKQAMRKKNIAARTDAKKNRKMKKSQKKGHLVPGF